MYKFIGKNKQYYILDPDEIIMKLNWKCPKGTIDDTFKCGNTPEEAKKNYNKIQKEKRAKERDKKRTKDASKKTKSVEKQIKKISNPELKLQIDNVKSLIDKVKSEKNSGKVSKQTYNELKDAVKELRNLTKKSSSISEKKIDSNTTKDLTKTRSDSSEHKNLVNSEKSKKIEMFTKAKEDYVSALKKANDRAKYDKLRDDLSNIRKTASNKYKDLTFSNINSMKPNETWSVDGLGEIHVNSVSNNKITITTNGATETYTKNELNKILSDIGNIYKLYDAEDSKIIKEKQEELSSEYENITKSKNEANKLMKELIDTAYDANIKSSNKKEHITNGSHKIKSVVHEFDDGIIIRVPENPKNLIYDVKQVYGKLMLLPETLRNEISNINILDEGNGDDKYWSEKLNTNFSSAGTGGDNVINLYYLNRGGYEKEVPLELLSHESGHNDDNKNNVYYSHGSEWTNAMKSDGNEYISDYAKLQKNNHEDYADSVKMFIENSDLMKNRYPNRYAILDKHYNGGLPLNRESNIPLKSIKKNKVRKSK